MVPDAINLLASSNLRRMREKDSSVCPDDSPLESLTPFSSCSAFLSAIFGSRCWSWLGCHFKKCKIKKNIENVVFLTPSLEGGSNGTWQPSMKAVDFLDLKYKHKVWYVKYSASHSVVSAKSCLKRNLSCPRSLLFLTFYDYNILQLSFLHLPRVTVCTPFQIYYPHPLLFIL